MFRVNAAGSSQQCHVCKGRVSHPQWKDSVCPVHGIMDRDVNAAAVIAKRFVPKLERVIASRKKAKSYTPGKPARRSADPKSSRKYPGCKNNVKKKNTSHHRKDTTVCLRALKLKVPWGENARRR